MAELVHSYIANGKKHLVYFDLGTKEVSYDVISPTQETAPLQPVVGSYTNVGCDGTTLDRLRYEGNNIFTYAPEYNSIACNYTPPADGTFIENRCNGTTLQQWVHDGNGGARWGDVVEANSTECGYVPPPPDPVYGCTDPNATNYNPNATHDDNSCTYPPAQYYPVGGVLPNPIEYTITADPMLEGQPKKNHFIKATLHRFGDNSLIGTMQARVRNGEARLDVSAFLRPMVNAGLSDVDSQIVPNSGAVQPFYLKYREMYNATEGEEVTRRYPKKVAVEAALNGYAETMEGYVLREGKETPANFMQHYRNPVAFSGLPYEVSVLIDEAMAGKDLYFERRYLDANRSELEILSSKIPAAYAGQVVRLQLDHYPLPCAVWVELAIVDADRSYFGSCPTTGGNKKGIFDRTFDFTFE